MEDKNSRPYYNTLAAELNKQPYSFYSFALFYEKGDIYECLRSLQQTT